MELSPQIFSSLIIKIMLRLSLLTTINSPGQKQCIIKTNSHKLKDSKLKHQLVLPKIKKRNVKLIKSPYKYINSIKLDVYTKCLQCFKIIKLSKIIKIIFLFC